jgi:hypothetical protein
VAVVVDHVGNGVEMDTVALLKNKALLAVGDGDASLLGTLLDAGLPPDYILQDDTNESLLHACTVAV